MDLCLAHVVQAGRCQRMSTALRAHRLQVSMTCRISDAELSLTKNGDQDLVGRAVHGEHLLVIVIDLHVLEVRHTEAMTASRSRQEEIEFLVVGGRASSPMALIRSRWAAWGAASWSASVSSCAGGCPSAGRSDAIISREALMVARWRDGSREAIVRWGVRWADEGGGGGSGFE